MGASIDNVKKQNILIVHNYYQIPGGEDTVVANEKQMLEEYGHKVILYSRSNSELKQMPKWQKLSLLFSTVFNLRTYRDIKQLIRMEHIDIVHVHNTLNLISPSVYYAARAMKIPVVQTIHNFRLLCPGATFYRDGHICEDCVTKGLKCAVKHGCYRGSKLQTLACVISATIHRMTGIYGKINYICLTEFNKAKLLQLKQINADRVFVKPNFVKVTVDEIIPYKKRKNQFVYVGRLDKLKGVDILFKAWKLMGEAAPTLLICGIGPMEKWCERYIHNNNLSSIKMMGFVPNNSVKKLIANSKALILPTQWYEGFPMTIVEAFSVATPVIGSNLGNVGSIIDDEINGWRFDYKSIDALYKTVMKSHDITKQIIQDRKKYESSTNYRKLIYIYDNCARWR